MTAELLFTICSRAVLPAWLLIAFLPRWIWTRRLVYSVWIPGLLAACYLFAVEMTPLRGLMLPDLTGDHAGVAVHLAVDQQTFIKQAFVPTELDILVDVDRLRLERFAFVLKLDFQIAGVGGGRSAGDRYDHQKSGQ